MEYRSNGKFHGYYRGCSTSVCPPGRQLNMITDWLVKPAALLGERDVLLDYCDYLVVDMLCK